MLRQWLNVAIDVLRAPIRTPDVLLVTGQASQNKIEEVETRLRFLFANIGNSPALRYASSASPLAYVRSRAVAAVDSEAVPAFARQRLEWVVDLDYETNLADGWSLIDLGAVLTGEPRRKVIKSAHHRFMNRIEALQSGGDGPVYLFGTGPSLGSAETRSFADGTTIVCNTIVRDKELWDHLAPAFLVAGDAIYHFGHTPHAAAFRADAVRRLRESNGRTSFVYPARFDSVVRSEFREVLPLLIPIPVGDHSDVTVDLTEHFSLPNVENVLNGLLLPLGCTLSRDVRLWGFDGRAPDDSGFWANSDRHAYPELMQSIRDAHPAFFRAKIPAGNEVQYMKRVHGDVLDQRLSEAEGRGFRFQMLHRTWTPTLQKRYIG